MPASRYILVVDDEPQIHRFLRPTLVAAGFAVESALSGAQALQKVRAAPPELIVLDLGLIDMDGSAVLAAIRQTSSVPVIILSARDSEADKVALLNAGADDYVSKPFGAGELIARINTALRHAVIAAGTTAVFEAGELTVDTLAHRVTLRGEPIKLTPREYDLLHLLARHAGRLLTHQHILREVWGPSHADDQQYLRVFVGRLRQKIEVDAAQPRLLLTESGVGYRLVAPTPSPPVRADMNVKDFLSPAAVFELRETDKRRVLKELARRAASLAEVDRDLVESALVKREGLGSSGLGNGVALPHARIGPLDEPFGLFALLRPAVQFDAIDELPVDLIFLLLLPERQPQSHLKAMACVARRLRDPVLIGRLRSTSGQGPLHALLTET